MSGKKQARLEADPLFLVEYMKLTLTDDIFTVMEEESISKTELANRLGKSRQYVSRILNETANFTLDSIARIAAALEKDVVLRLMNYEDEVVIR
ncbi:MAG: helix-turn-helix transcriptional regulator, partial [Candidatus Fermentibacteraceae bacterium]|nr:helix-turn-helix transcriptional regulator [Candidatus Fermentibacteraceae bacterium]